MKTSEITVTVLEASQGEFLTQSNLEEGVERTFVTKVFLAQGSMSADWRTVTGAEKEQYERQKETNTSFE